MTTNNAINLNSQGVAYYDGVSTFSGLDGSTTGFVLTSNGTGVAPSFQTPLFPITPFVVGPSGIAGYSTIQAGLNAANTAGGGIVYVMPGTYTENLTLYDGVSIVGVPRASIASSSANSTVIIGVHTPPTTGFTAISDCFLQNAGDIFSSVAAGTAQVALQSCSTQITTSGYTFNLPNWAFPGGIIAGINVEDTSTDNGVVNNTGGAIVFFEASRLGAGTTTMVISNLTFFRTCSLGCPLNAVTGGAFLSDNSIHNATLTFSNNSAAEITNGRITSSPNASVVMSSSGNVSLNQCTIETNNNPAIDGAGSGTLSLNDITFTQNSSIANTLTLSTSGGFYPSGDMSTVGSVLTSNGTSVCPTFQSVPFTKMPWTDESSNFSAVSGNGYFVTATATATLPASPVQGDVIAFSVDVDPGTGLLTIQANTGQVIRLGNVASAAAGTAVNNFQGDSITLVYRASDTTWITSAAIGEWSIT